MRYGICSMRWASDSNQILHSDKDHQLHFVGGLSRCRTNSRWRTAAILKNLKKRPYLLNGLTDLNAIWHSDARGPFEPYQQLKYQTFNNRRWRRAAILKGEKGPYLGNGLTYLHKIWHTDAYWPSQAYQRLKFRTFKNTFCIYRPAQLKLKQYILGSVWCASHLRLSNFACVYFCKKT